MQQVREGWIDKNEETNREREGGTATDAHKQTNTKTHNELICTCFLRFKKENQSDDNCSR